MLRIAKSISIVAMVTGLLVGCGNTSSDDGSSSVSSTEYGQFRYLTSAKLLVTSRKAYNEDFSLKGAWIFEFTNFKRDQNNKSVESVDLAVSFEGGLSNIERGDPLADIRTEYKLERTEDSENYSPVLEEVSSSQSGDGISIVRVEFSVARQQGGSFNSESIRKIEVKTPLMDEPRVYFKGALNGVDRFEVMESENLTTAD